LTTSTQSSVSASSGARAWAWLFAVYAAVAIVFFARSRFVSGGAAWTVAVAFPFVATGLEALTSLFVAGLSLAFGARSGTRALAAAYARARFWPLVGSAVLLVLAKDHLAQSGSALEQVPYLMAVLAFAAIGTWALVQLVNAVRRVYGFGWVRAAAVVIPAGVVVSSAVGLSAGSYNIPSGAMSPNILMGDHVIANNLAYGFHLESVGLDNRWADPERGDVVIFGYPVPGPDQGKDYVKRVVGLPGERVRLEDNVLVVNGTKVVVTALDKGVSCKDGVPDQIHCDTQVEQLGRHSVVTQHQDAPSCALRGACDSTWPARTRPRCFGSSPCLYFGAGDANPEWPDVLLPVDTFLLMGDNRDNSSDSRYWGLVSRADIRSEAVLVW